MTTFVDRHRSDFNYNGGSFNATADLLWRDAAGHNVVWIAPSFIAPDTLPTVPPDWHVKAVADFDPLLGGTGNADILWQNDNGALALWQMEGATVSAIGALPNPGPSWHIAGDNNFIDSTNLLGDDILWRNDNGALAMWTGIKAATGTVTGMFALPQNPGPTWHVVGTGDTDNDGRAGILWQNDNGALAIWENLATNTFTFNTVALLPTVDPSWHVKGMADISGDGRSDVVFQNDNGAVAIWEMGGAAGTTINALNLVDLDPGPAWHIVGLRELTHDAQIDILFQHDNGEVAAWARYESFGNGSATFHSVGQFTLLDPNPNGHVWDLL